MMMMSITVEQVVAAYAFTPGEITQLAALLSDVYLTAAQDAYQKALATVKTHITLAHPWTPTPGDRISAEAWARTIATGIATTYQTLLSHFLERLPVFAAADNNGTASAPAKESAHATGEEGMVGTLTGIAASIKAWLMQMLSWKIPQIVQNVYGTGANAGTERAIHDILAELGNLATSLLANANARATNPQGLLAKLLAHIRVRVLPATSSGDFCRKYAGKSYSLAEAASLPSFPAHPSCIHYKEVYVVL
jgi:hypothetical protein